MSIAPRSAPTAFRGHDYTEYLGEILLAWNFGTLARSRNDEVPGALPRSEADITVLQDDMFGLKSMEALTRAGVSIKIQTLCVRHASVLSACLPILLIPPRTGAEFVFNIH